jgi:hypothetical protein
MTSQIKFTLLLVSILALMLLTAVPGLAATSEAGGLTMEVTPAYQGYFKYGEWLPVWVTLDNTGADLQAEVRVRVAGSTANSLYAVPVSLPAGAHKVVPLYVLPNNFSHQLYAELVTGGEVLVAETITVRPQPNINYLIGIVGRERGALSLLQSIKIPSNRTQFLVDVTIAELPERSAALNTFDCLILNDVDTSGLTPDQKDALLAWVQAGGRLVIGGGAGTLQTANGLPEDLLPLKPSGVVELESLDALSKWAEAAPIRVPGPFAVATGPLTEGAILASQGDDPLVLEKTVAKGWVDFIAVDLSAAPFDAWSGTTAFWESLITPGAAYPEWMPPDMSSRQLVSNAVNNALYNLPSLDLPSARWLIVMLAVYILLVGPVNYFILRQRKKLHLAWITIPAITLLFSGMSFGLGYAKRGTDLIINKIAIVRAQPAGPARVYTYIGLFSPANLSYQIDIEGQHLLSPVMMDYYDPWAANLPDIPAITYVQGDPSQVRGLTVNQWSMQSFMTESTWEIGEMRGELVVQDGKLTGMLSNQSDYDLKDVVAVLHNNFVRLGDLAAGDSVEVNLELGDFENVVFGGGISWRIYESQFDPASRRTSRETDFRRMILEGVLDQGFMYGGSTFPGSVRSAKDLDFTSEATILGWIDQAPPKVLVNGTVPQETANALYLAQLAYHYPSSGRINVPVGMIPGVVAEMPVAGGICGGMTTSLWFDRGEAVMEFILPPEIAGVSPEAMQLFIKSDASTLVNLKVELFAWESEAWQTLGNVRAGFNQLTNPQTWISTDGLVRVRLSRENDFQGGGCYYAGLGLTGQRP